MKLAAFFMSAVLVGQVPTSLNFGSPAVSAPIPSATAVGATGFTNTFYWVVARTPGGYSSPGAAIATNTVGSANFSVSNYVVISWPAISGATGYDVIRSDSPSYPASTSCASCAVALNQAGTSFSDQGGATSAYSGGAQSVASQAIFTLDNVTVATPQINVQILNSRQNVTFSLPSTGLGTVTSVGLSLPGIFTVSGSPVTTTGTLTGTLATQTANTIWAGPTTGAAAAPTFRVLVAADMPSGVIPTGNAVGGASNLTTVGAVPYVSAAGVINQATSLVVSGAGTTAEALTVYNSIASGVTKLTVKAGAGQSTTNLQEWQNSSGTVLASVSSAGVLTGNGPLTLAASAASNINLNTSSGGQIVAAGHIQVYVSSNASVLFGTTPDTSLSRVSAGIVGVGTGAAGSVAGTLQAATLQALGNGSASNAMLLGTGTWFTGGSATTTKPYLLVEPSGTTSTGWSTSGTGIGVNAASGFAGNLLDLQVAGASKGKVSATGILTTGSHVLSGGNIEATGYFGFNSLATIKSTSSGVLTLGNYADPATDFSRLQFGGTTSSFPALKRSTTGIVARLADDSSDTWLQASRFQLTGGQAIYGGAGSPESVVTAVVGSLFLRTDGGAATTLYVKESGSGNTGWIAK